MDRMRQVVDLLNKYAYEYYVKDNPTVSDKEYDVLYDELLKLETEVEKIPEVSSEVLTIFDSLEELKTNINDYEQFKENVVSFIEELYYVIN